MKKHLCKCREWIRGKLWEWFFKEEDARRSEELMKAAGLAAEGKEKIATTTAFLGQQLMNAEREIVNLKDEVKKVSSENYELQERIILSQPIRQLIEDRPPDLIKKINPIYKNVTIYKSKSKMKIKYKLISQGAMPPVRIQKSSSAYSLFLPAHESHETPCGAFTKTEIDLGIAIEIPEGYVGRIVAPASMQSNSCLHLLEKYIFPGIPEPISISLLNNHETGVLLEPTQRIAMLFVEKDIDARLVEDENLEVDLTHFRQHPSASDLQSSNGNRYEEDDKDLERWRDLPV